jgi:hypothetical protein
MKRWLILGILVAIAATGNASPGTGPHPQQVVDNRVVQQPPSKQAQQPAPPRHLSEQERAELRRQLHQFNQQYTRRQ